MCILGKGGSNLIKKSQKQLFCEENRLQKVVQFQNGILWKFCAQPTGSIPEWNGGQLQFAVDQLLKSSVVKVTKQYVDSRDQKKYYERKKKETLAEMYIRQRRLKSDPKVTKTGVL